MAQPAASPSLQAYNNTTHSTIGMTPQYVVFGRHARLPVDWATGLSPTVESHTLQGWVKQHQRALSHTYQAVKKQSQHREEWDQARYNRRAKLAPLLSGERVLVRNFRRRIKGKLTPRWTQEPFVVVTQLREGHPVYVLRPEGKEAPTRTVHRNNLLPMPFKCVAGQQGAGGSTRTSSSGPAKPVAPSHLVTSWFDYELYPATGNTVNRPSFGNQ